MLRSLEVRTPEPRARPAPGDATDRTPALPLDVGLLIVLFAIGFAGQGGFYSSVQIPMALVLVAASAAAWRRRGLRFLRSPPLWPLSIGFAVWAVVSATANGAPVKAAGTVALVGGLLLVGSIASGLGDEQRDLLVVGLIALGCAVALTGWVGVLSHVNLELWAADVGVRRAATSLTYTGAAAGLLGPLALVAIARASCRRTAGSHAAVCMLAVGLAATLSRVGGLAFTAGLLSLLILLGPAAILRGAVPGMIGAGLALAGARSSFVVAPPTSMLRTVTVLGMGVAVAVVLGRCRERVLAATGTAAAAAGAVAVWSGAVGVLVDTERWSLVSPLRGAAVPAALDVGLDAPVLGAGPGQAVLRWTDAAGEHGTRYAHNEYVQTFAETGAVGLVLVVALVIATCLATLRQRRDPSPGWPLGPAVTAALVDFAIHSGGDFLWRIPVLPLLVAALVGLALTKQPPTTTGGNQRWTTSTPKHPRGRARARPSTPGAPSPSPSSACS